MRLFVQRFDQKSIRPKEKKLLSFHPPYLSGKKPATRLWRKISLDKTIFSPYLDEKSDSCL